MKQEHKTYEEALHELEAIVDKMENNQLGLDELTSQLKHAQQLIKLCKDRLTKPTRRSAGYSRKATKLKPKYPQVTKDAGQNKRKNNRYQEKL